MTFLKGDLLHLKNVKKISVESDLHPFAAGLVVRRVGDEVIVGARGGALHLGVVEDAVGKDAKLRLREGLRLITPSTRLEQARNFQPRLSSKGFGTCMGLDAPEGAG